MKKIHPFRLFLQILFVAIIFGVFLSYPKVIVMKGETMGTSYTIKAYVAFWRSQQKIQELIDQRLAQISQVFSTYSKDSELSQFNQNTSDDVIKVSKELYDVLNQGKTIFEKSGGAWDATIYPLFETWGFMSDQKPNLPSKEEVQTLRQKIGYQHLRFVGPQRIRKTQKNIQVDLSSIVKGYAVDEVAKLLELAKSQHFLIEIGGEMFAKGQRDRLEKWQVGINNPDPNAAINDILMVVELKNKALATSGDYRNFFEHNGKRYSHILDPRTGYPVKHQSVSVTIVAKTCLLADALATAAMVLEPKEALALVKDNRDAEMLLIENVGGTYKKYMTRGFKDLVNKKVLSKSPESN